MSGTKPGVNTDDRIGQLEQRLDDLEQENESLRTTVERKTRKLVEHERKIGALESTVDDLEEETEYLRGRLNPEHEAWNDAEDVAKEAVETAEQAKEIAAASSAKVHQLETDDVDDTDESDGPNLPAGVEQSSSPLDFFANCRVHRVKRRFVQERNETNTYRAIMVARRWEEFATRRNDGSGVFFDREDVANALTAIMGKKPHHTTITRVWESMKQLGGNDLREKRRRVSNNQDPKDILEMDAETATGLLDARYGHLDLLNGSEVGTGGVTPVVTGPEAAGV